MVRKVSFLFMLTVLVLAACGRQVTPNRTSGTASGLQPGFMSIKFRVPSGFDFANNRYAIVFNTSGTTGVPYANAFVNGFVNYSFALIVGANAGQPPGVALFEYLQNPAGGLPQRVQLQYTPQQVVFLPNSNGLGTEFSITFARSLFFGIQTTATPSPTPTSSPTPMPSPSPTPTSSASPSPSPSPSPTGTPGVSQGTWYFNFFTTDSSGNPLDALGPNGIADTSFSLALPTTQVFDQTFNTAGQPQVNPATAQIFGGEIANQP